MNQYPEELMKFTVLFTELVFWKDAFEVCPPIYKISYHMPSLRALNLSHLIWSSTILTLGSLALCWYMCELPNPTILEAAKAYPNTIIFRVGMMYSLFLTFLQLLAIKWWINGAGLPHAHMTTMTIFGTIGLASYGLFVSTVDLRRINYLLAENASFIAALGSSVGIYTIMLALKANRKMVKSGESRLALTNERSWFLKKLFSLCHLLGFVMGVLIYVGYLDVIEKRRVEYLLVISTSLFFWSFTMDFKGYKLDIMQLNGQE